MNSEIRIDTAIVPRLLMLSPSGFKVLWYLLMKMKNQGLQPGQYLEISQAEMMRICNYSSSWTVHNGLNDLIEANIVERGPVSKMYRVVLKGITV